MLWVYTLQYYYFYFSLQLLSSLRDSKYTSVHTLHTIALSPLFKYIPFIISLTRPGIETIRNMCVEYLETNSEYVIVDDSVIWNVPQF